MAAVTVDVGATCAGGNHVELIVSVNAVEAYRQWVPIDQILPGGFGVNSVHDAAMLIIGKTTAPNINAWKNKIKNDSADVPDGLPV
jgi:hypothetical protein